MKKIILGIITLFSFSLSAQSPIINLEDKGDSWQTGAYYKDNNNLLSPYIGTFIYTNGTITLKIVLVKKMQQYDGKYYEDLLIGGYEYKDGDMLIVSTISDLSNDYSNQCGHSISGNSLITKTNKPNCNECGANEFRLRLTFFDKERELSGSMITRKIMHNNQEAIKVFIRCEPLTIYTGDVPPPTQFRVPDGEYVLIKQ